METYRRRFPLILAICFTSCFLMALSVHKDVREAFFYKLEGKALFGNVTERHLTEDSMACSLLCLKSTSNNCFSFNFGGLKKQCLYECELSSSERRLNPENLQVRQGSSYFGMTEDSLYMFSPCLSTPCHNGGSCVNGLTLDTFTCNCHLEVRVLPYFGRQCDVVGAGFSMARLVFRCKRR